MPGIRSVAIARLKPCYTDPDSSAKWRDFGGLYEIRYTVSATINIKGRGVRNNASRFAIFSSLN